VTLRIIFRDPLDEISSTSSINGSINQVVSESKLIASSPSLANISFNFVFIAETTTYKLSKEEELAFSCDQQQQEISKMMFRLERSPPHYARMVFVWFGLILISTFPCLAFPSATIYHWGAGLGLLTCHGSGSNGIQSTTANQNKNIQSNKIPLCNGNSATITTTIIKTVSNRRLRGLHNAIQQSFRLYEGANDNNNNNDNNHNSKKDNNHHNHNKVRFKTFDLFLEAFHEEPVIIYFSTRTCGPCQLMKKELEEVRKTVGDEMKIFSIDTEKWPQVGSRFAISRLPCLVVAREGQVLLRMEGVIQADKVVAQVRTLIQ
jgi:thiol-disulfide isomerase/thioredoxin